MYFHEILQQLNELRAEWRKQDFKFTKEQKEKFEMLQELRRARVNYFYENGLVSTGKKDKEKVSS
jgi:hypothetical protein